MIDHNKKFIFFHIPKTAGRSLLNYFFGRDFRDTHRISLSLSKLKKEKYSDYFAFTFVRNPWDRLVSMYHHYLKGGNNKLIDKDIGRCLRKMTFEGLVRNLWIADKLIPHFGEIECLLMPQTDYLYVNKLFVPDFVGRFENLQNDIYKVCDILSLEKRSIVHKNKSTHDHYVEYYNDTTREIVSDFYKRDIEVFNYKFK